MRKWEEPANHTYLPASARHRHGDDQHGLAILASMPGIDGSGRGMRPPVLADGAARGALLPPPSPRRMGLLGRGGLLLLLLPLLLAIEGRAISIGITMSGSTGPPLGWMADCQQVSP